jgi:nucleoside-diphosphate-sugar epimerase
MWTKLLAKESATAVPSRPFRPPSFVAAGLLGERDRNQALLVRRGGAPVGLAGERLRVTKEGAARGDVGRTGADTTLIRSELGWTPRTSLPEGLAAQLAAASS